MITDKIKALFNFIEFLHSNIDNFKQYDSLINELYSLDIERNNVKPLNNFADKLKYDEIQSIILDKFKTIQSNIIQPIQDKSNELNICDWNKTETLWNYNILEISELKDNFTANDIPEIQKHKNKYIEFRTVTNCTYFNRFFFNDLDQTLKVLFDFFKESTENEFEAFETKKIMVNNISEAVELLRTKTTNVKDFEKDELFKNTVFFYTSIRFNKDNLKGVFSKHYETKDDFLKTLYLENTRIFFRSAIIQKNEDFVKSINNEFMLFCTYNSVTTEIKESWLKKTYQFITKVNDLSEFIDKPTVCLFVNWYNETIKTLKNETTDLKDISTTENNYLGQPTNENANLFFEFLCEHYRPEDKTQVKYVNILYYLKNDAEKKHFIYKVKQKDYKKLIESKGIKISKFEKSANYEEVEKPIFYTLEKTFLKNKTV